MIDQCNPFVVAANLAKSGADAELITSAIEGGKDISARVHGWSPKRFGRSRLDSMVGMTPAELAEALRFWWDEDQKNGLTAPTFYGFCEGNEAWFHTKEAALRFADACGWSPEETEDGLEETQEPFRPAIMDTVDQPWTL